MEFYNQKEELNRLEKEGLKVICRGDSFKQKKVFTFIYKYITIFKNFLLLFGPSFIIFKSSGEKNTIFNIPNKSEALFIGTLFIAIPFDLLFKFYLPYNDIKLGNNWAIALLIPFILLKAM